MNRIELGAKNNSLRVARRDTGLQSRSSHFPDNALQRGLGNRQLTALIQTKLKVGGINDPLEKQADRIADRVVRGPVPAEPIKQAATGLLRKCSTCEDDDRLLQRKADHAASNQAGANSVAAGMPQLNGGRAMPEASRAYFEPRFGGADFSGVRLHTNREAAAVAAGVNAKAFTLGRDIVFAEGEYRPGTEPGNRLLAHELTHVVQQRHGAQQVQRQPRAGEATEARRGSTYYFAGCDDGQMEILDRTIRQAYLMVQRAQAVLTDYLLAGAVAESPEYDTNINYEMLRRLLRSEFGASTSAQVREIKWKFLMMEYKMRRGLEIECHTDPARNQIAEAEVPGRRMWFGSLFFNTFTDELHSRPRVFVHELAHTVGIGHDMVGLSVTAGSDVVDAAEYAFHADAFATLATRLYTGRLWQRLERNSDI